MLLIGVGGMGEVYRAYDTVKERTVAVKVLRAEMAADPNYQERFRRESRIAARLQEPHVIPVHDFGDIDGVLYIDMRLVEGGSLKDELRANGPLDPGRATSIIAQVAAALDAAHADGLVHRDIKPENVLLTPDDFAYLVDFGIAHGGGEASVTRTGLVIGSCAYMAAERFSGGQVGPSSDVYSLTCLLYECLTGRPPFEAGDLRQLMSAHMFSPPPRPSIMRRGINRAFDDVIAKGMAKKPADRYASAGELARAATAAALGAQVPPAPVVPPGPPPPAATRQFSAAYANPAGTGYTPYPPPVIRPPEALPRKSRFGRSQVALVVATIVLFGVAVVLATKLLSGNGDTAAPPQTTMAVPPPSVTTRRDGRAVDDDATVRDIDDDDHHADHDVTDDQRRTATGRVGDRCAGLRRAFGALRRGEHAGGRDQNRELTGGRVPDGAGQLLLPRRTAERRRQSPTGECGPRRRWIRCHQSRRRRPLRGAAGSPDDLQQRASGFGGAGIGVLARLAIPSTANVPYRSKFRRIVER